MKFKKLCLITTAVFIFIYALSACDNVNNANNNNETAILYEEIVFDFLSTTAADSAVVNNTVTVADTDSDIIINYGTHFGGEKNPRIIYDNEGLFITGDNERTQIFSKSGKMSEIEKPFGGYYFSDVDYSLDRKKAAFMQQIGWQLYFISEDDFEPVLIDHYVYCFKMSASGNGVAYTDSEYPNAYLYLWDGETSELVTEKCYDPYDFCISPDGKTIGYNEYDNETERFSGYFYNNGKSLSLGEGTRVFAVTDNARTVFFTVDGEYLYAQHGDDIDTRVLLATDNSGRGLFDYSFNKDMTEMMYTNGDEINIIKTGSEKYKIFQIQNKKEFEPRYRIFPPYTSVKYNDFEIYGIDSFADTYYLTYYDTIVHITEDFHAEITASDVKTRYSPHMITPQVSTYGNILTYETNGQIRRMDFSDPENTDVCLTDEPILFFVSTNDGSGLYYFNEKTELYFIDEQNNKTLVCNDVVDKYGLDNDYHSTGNFRMALFEDKKLYFLSDEKLLFSDGGPAKEIPSATGEVFSIELISGMLNAHSDDGEFLSADGEIFYTPHDLINAKNSPKSALPPAFPIDIPGIGEPLPPAPEVIIPVDSSPPFAFPEEFIAEKFKQMPFVHASSESYSGELLGRSADLYLDLQEFEENFYETKEVSSFDSMTYNFDFIDINNDGTPEIYGYKHDGAGWYRFQEIDFYDMYAQNPSNPLSDDVPGVNRHGQTFFAKTSGGEAVLCSGYFAENIGMINFCKLSCEPGSSPGNINLTPGNFFMMSFSEKDDGTVFCDFARYNGTAYAEDYDQTMTQDEYRELFRTVYSDLDFDIYWMGSGILYHGNERTEYEGLAAFEKYADLISQETNYEKSIDKL
jgi:hypothetical protein